MKRTSAGPPRVRLVDLARRVKGERARGMPHGEHRRFARREIRGHVERAGRGGGGAACGGPRFRDERFGARALWNERLGQDRRGRARSPHRRCALNAPVR